MTTSDDRLDQIEAILAELARRQAQTQEQIDGRLGRIEQVVESNARAIEAWSSRSDAADDRLSRIEQVTESNARAIEAWSGRIDDGGTRLEAAISDTVAMIADLGRQQQETDQRFEVFLEESRADRAEMRASREQSERDRALNESEHRAFRETFQTLLAEISRLWQRVS